MRRWLFTLIALSTIGFPAHAQTGAEVPAPGPSSAPASTPDSTAGVAAPRTPQEREATKQFLGVGLGLGLGLSVAIGNRPRIEAAEVVNGVVRVTKVNNDAPRILFETHYFFTRSTCTLCGLIKIHDKPELCGFGPFVGIQSSSDEVIDTIAGGIMFGFRRDLESQNSFNLGFGVIVDPHTKLLGDGIKANQPLPQGDSLRFKETTGWGALALVSFSY